MSLWTILERARRLYPEHSAVVDGGRCVSYAELGRRVDTLALHFLRRGIAPGDRIAALVPNSCACLEAYYAAAGLGAIFVPLNTRLHPDELAFILGDSGAVALLADPIHAELAAEVLGRSPGVRIAVSTGAPFPAATLSAVDGYPEAESGAAFQAVVTPPEQVAQLYYTSGTTGHPKGVMLTHRNVWAHALAAIAELGLSERDTWAHIAPMFHLADAWATFAITWVGGRHVMLARFEAREALALIQRERVSLTNLVPTMLNLMVKHEDRARFDYSSLRMILSGGAPIAPAVVRAIIDTFGCEYVQTYGMTETSPFLTLSLLKPHLRAAPMEQQLRYRAKTGRPFLAVELRIVDDAGRPVAADEREVGEIQVRGETVTPGYWNRPDATAEAFTSDGWLRTGDLAVVDEEGYVTIVDRKKDMIITGGEKVYSTEVEFVLYQHPAVLEAAVFGSPDPVWGEVVTAAVVTRPGMDLSEEELVAFCRPRLAAFKLPRRVRFLAELPKTGSGKILKRALSADPATGRPMPPRVTNYSTTLPSTRPGWRRVLGSTVSIVLHVLVIALILLRARSQSATGAGEQSREETIRPIQLAFAPPRPKPTPRPPQPPQPPAVPITEGQDQTPGTTARAVPKPEEDPNADPNTARSVATRPDPGDAEKTAESHVPPPPPSIAAPSPSTAPNAQPSVTLESEAHRIFGRPSSKLGPLAGTRDNRPWESPVELDSRGCTVPEEAPDSTLPAGMALIVGRIFNERTGEPLAGARLQILGTQYGTFSNDRGDYKLYFDRTLVNRCRSQSVRVTAPGYQGRDVQLIMGATPNGDVPLSRY